MPASETTRSKFIDPVVRSNAVGRNALLPIRSFIHYDLNHPSRVRKHSIKSDTHKIFFSLAEAGHTVLSDFLGSSMGGRTGISYLWY